MAALIVAVLGGAIGASFGGVSGGVVGVLFMLIAWAVLGARSAHSEVRGAVQAAASHNQRMLDLFEYRYKRPPKNDAELEAFEERLNNP